MKTARFSRCYPFGPSTAAMFHFGLAVGFGLVLLQPCLAGDFSEDARPNEKPFAPTAGQWAPTGSLHVGRYVHTATLLKNGKVLVTGGLDETFTPTISAEVFDPATGTWAVTGSMTGSRESHTATLLQDGRVLVAGGFSPGAGSLNTAEIYDPATGTWTATESLTTEAYLSQGHPPARWARARRRRQFEHRLPFNERRTL